MQNRKEAPKDSNRKCSPGSSYIRPSGLTPASLQDTDLRRDLLSDESKRQAEEDDLQLQVAVAASIDINWGISPEEIPEYVITRYNPATQIGQIGPSSFLANGSRQARFYGLDPQTHRDRKSVV
jgi:hypothetical protein